MQLHPDHTPLLRTEYSPEAIRICKRCYDQVMYNRKVIVQIHMGTLFPSKA